MRQFSDDGTTLHGAYGPRLRNADGADQIRNSAMLLARDPHSRRVVLSLWNASDLGSTSKDVPCNVIVMMKVRGERLDMTVVSRSCDVFLGLPYDVFSFAVLHAEIARLARLDIGDQCHFLDSLHLYDRDVSAAITVARDRDRFSESWRMHRLSTLDLAEVANCKYEQIAVPERLDPTCSTEALLLSRLLWDSEQTSHTIDRLPAMDASVAALLWFSKYRRLAPGQFPEWAASWREVP